MGSGLAVLPIAGLLACSCGGKTERALVTVVPQAGQGVEMGWSMPVQLTITQDGKRVSDIPLGHVIDIELRPASYMFALYDEACPTGVKLYGDDHVLLDLTLYEQDRCEMSLSNPLSRVSARAAPN